ncbi:PAS domain-containing protein [Streptomyces sp. 8N706]|uniref:PAS domain-containing protein n=1 Tax=Streptomyces sp. 8N706 TaxID=3457416 RepID=UPI003FD6848D
MSTPDAAHSANPGSPFDVAHAATAVVDAHGVIERWSLGAQALLGYPAADIVGQPVTALLAVGGAGDAAAPLSERRRTGDGWEAVAPVRHRDGRRLELGLRACRLWEVGGRRSWLVAVTDVVGLREWERDQAVLRGLFTQSPIGMAVVDARLRYMLINPAMERLDGVPARQRLGRRLGEAMPGLDGAALEQEAQQVLETGEPMLTFQQLGAAPGDSPTYAGRDRVRSGSAFRLVDASGRVLGVCHTALDVTSHYRAR